MKVWRKRIIRFSFRDNRSSPVFAHTLLAMSLLGGYLILGLGTAGVLAYVGLRTDSTQGPWHHLLVQFCSIACAVISASTYPAWRRFVAPGSNLVRLAVEIKFCLLTLVRGVEVWWLMLPVEHANHDSKESRGTKSSLQRCARFRGGGGAGLTAWASAASGAQPDPTKS